MKRILPAIVIAQFFCTSLWFAGNAIMPDLMKNFDVDQSFLANLTSSIQFGFIAGTFLFALLTVPDRFSPSLVFFVCSIIAGLFNLALSTSGISAPALLLCRFFTGFFLAGIYPVGMKIAADYYQKGLGKSLGFLVAALVLGTAFPHLLKSIGKALPWKYVIYSTSALSALGGLIILMLVPDGPFRKPGQNLKLTAFASGFRNKNFRSASLGYFGHMWELYSFWAFVPVMLTTYNNVQQNNLDVSWLSFLIMASGSIACVVSGIFSQHFGVKKVATISLFLSCLCCLLSPFFLVGSPPLVLVAFLVFWGLVVIADSPLFSTLVAQNIAEQSRGTALTIVNCIGFSITIISIQITKVLLGHINNRYIYMLLAVGPVVGLAALLKNKENRT